MQISELAQKTGVSLRSIRYYEQKNLLQPSRLKNGYRDYSQIAIEQIRMIQLYLSMGLNTNEIADIFQCLNNNGQVKSDCIPNAIKKGEMKLTEVREQIAFLRRAEAQLMEIVAELKNNLQQGDEKNGN